MWWSFTFLRFSCRLVALLDACLPARFFPARITSSFGFCFAYALLCCASSAHDVHTLCIHGEDAKWHILKNCREMKATLHKIRYIHAVVAYGEREREREREWINFRWCARIQMKHLSRLNVQAKGRQDEGDAVCALENHITNTLKWCGFIFSPSTSTSHWQLFGIALANGSNKQASESKQKLLASIQFSTLISHYHRIDD